MNANKPLLRLNSSLGFAFIAIGESQQQPNSMYCWGKNKKFSAHLQNYRRFYSVAFCITWFKSLVLRMHVFWKILFKVKFYRTDLFNCQLIYHCSNLYRMAKASPTWIRMKRCAHIPVKMYMNITVIVTVHSQTVR